MSAAVLPPPPAVRPRKASARLRRNLRCMTGDGFSFSVMVGCGETYIQAFTLALGKGELIGALIATVPMLLGGLMQLISPRGAVALRSYRRWVVLCATLQSLSFLALAYGAFQGSLSTVALFAAVSLYWGAGLATGPAWNTWVEDLVPGRIRANYFACRTRLAQAGVLIGLIGAGIALQSGRAGGFEMKIFGGMFLTATAARFISSRCLAAQNEPSRGRVRELVGRRGETSLKMTDSNRRLLAYLMVMQGAVYLSGPFFAAYMLKHLAMSYMDFVILIASAYVARILVLPGLGRMANRFGADKVLWLGAIGITPLPALWLVSNDFWFLLGLQVAGGAVWAAQELAMMLLFFESIPRASRTRTLAHFNLANAAAMATGTAIGAIGLRYFGEAPGTYLLLFASSSVIRILAVMILGSVPQKLHKVLFRSGFWTGRFAPPIYPGRGEM